MTIELILVLLGIVILLSSMGLLASYILYLKFNAKLKVFSDKLEQNIFVSKVDIEDKIESTINSIDDMSVFLRTKGFTISLVSGLKEKMEELLQTSHDEQVDKQGTAPIATPASYTGKI